LPQRMGRVMAVGVSSNSFSTNPLGVRWPDQHRSWVVVAIATIVGVLVAVGLLIVARRLTGALGETMPRSALLLTALVATSIVACCRIAWRRAFPIDPHQSFYFPPIGDKVIGWGSSLALGLLAFGSCYPANHTSDWLIWLPMLVADQFWRQTFFDAGHPGTTPDRPHTPPTAPAEQVLQQLFRLRDDSGCESIYGSLQADFQPGQRHATLHVGFCPPLSRLPKMEVEPSSGPPATVKVVQALAHGTRLEVRLKTPAVEACRVLVDMAAVPVEGD